MKSVYKFNLLIDDEPTELQVPEGGVALTAQMQGDKLQLWVYLDPSTPLVRRTFVVVGTGQKLFESLGELAYVSTFQLQDGRFVFHVFEIV